ncbi:glycosyltransferase family 61 protein [Desulfovibrio sp. OttesenSCG-928-G15]|nr:glycosyltransferase family 61 protein [Desulfovibrio sp. OttesenSCG-928-G15]
MPNIVVFCTFFEENHIQAGTRMADFRTLSFTSKDLPIFVSAQHYFSEYPDRGKPFFAKPFAKPFYMAKKCLVAGIRTQNILPLWKNNNLKTVFEESHNYQHLDGDRISSYISIRENDTEKIDLAVPVFPLDARNFGHWILESLSRILALEEYGYTGPYIVYANAPHIFETLELFGIGPDRILTNDKKYVVDTLIIPPILNNMELQADTVIVPFLRSKLLNAVGTLPGKKRVYIRRTGTRKVVNEDEVLDILQRYDFEEFVPDGKHCREQFQYMSNADFSVMAHGANVALTLTQPENSHFIEFFGDAAALYFYFPVVKNVKFEYHPIVEGASSAFSSTTGNKPAFKDIRVPVPLFEYTLERLLAK